MTTLILVAALALFQEVGRPAKEVQERTMEPGGWAFMIAAWAFILVLTFYTFSKVLRGGRK